MHSERMKIRAFYGEFPFLYDLVSPSLVREVKVQRWDSSMLELVPCRQMYSEVPTTNNHIFLLNDKGEKIGLVGRRDGKATWWNPFTWSRGTTERLPDRILAMGEQASQVKLIVVFASGFSHNNTLTIYKPSGGYDNLKDWFDNELKMAADKARTALA